MNLESMQTALKRFGFDNTDPLITWINAAMHDIEDSFDWPWLESKATSISMPSGSSTITLPENCLKIITVKDATNLRKLEYYDRHKFVREIHEPLEIGLAEVYTLINTNQLQIWRVLQEETIFEVMYQATTPDLAEAEDVPTTDKNVWPPNTHYLIVLGAAAIAQDAEDEDDRSKSIQEKYDKSLMKLMAKFGERELDEPTTVQDVQGYGTVTATRWR